MRRPWIVTALFALLPLVATSTRAADFPQFEAAFCCQLCPRAADPASYDTKFLNSFRTLVQGDDGWLFRSEADLLTDFAPDAEGLNRFVRLHRALRERGVELVMTIQPPRGLMHADKLDESVYDADAARASYLRTLHGLRANGVVVPPLEKLLDEKGAEDYFWRTDHHWTPDGTRRTAQLVAETVRGLSQYDGIQRQKFVTRREGLLARGGTLAHAASDLCGYGAPKQYVARYVTEQASSDTGSDLFGDETLPQITLIGTSNSGATYNFNGFLSEYMEADVLNASVLGGGMDGAILSYLSSEEFRSSPPKILIWELQHFHKLGDPDFHRQVLPLLDDGCNGKPAMLEREVTLGRGNNEVLFNGGGAVRSLKGRDYVLDVQFSDPGVLEMRGVVWYTTGTKSTVRIEHSQHAPSHKGRFVTALRDDAHWADEIFLGFDIEIVPPEPGTEPTFTSAGPQRVRARLCEKRGGAMTAAMPATTSEVLR